MKKFYFLAAIAAIGLASCSSEEEVRVAEQPQEITLGAVNQKATKAAISGADIDQNVNLYVTGIYNSVVNSEDWNEHFYNREFSMKAGGYKATPSLYYPTSGGVRFWAYACDSLSDRKLPVKDGVVTYTAKGNFASMVLDYKNGTNKLEGSTDLMYSKIYDVPDVTAPDAKLSHQLEFRHTLAWIVVNMINGNSDANDAMEIYDVRIVDAHLTGVATITPSEDAADNGCWYGATSMTQPTPLCLLTRTHRPIPSRLATLPTTHAAC